MSTVSKVSNDAMMQMKRCWSSQIHPTIDQDYVFNLATCEYQYLYQSSLTSRKYTNILNRIQTIGDFARREILNIFEAIAKLTGGP